MKTKSIKFITVAVCATAIACLSASYTYKDKFSSNASMLSQNEVEALSSCEAKLNGKVVLKCVGEEGWCSTTIKKWGQTASVDCSGKKIEV